MSLTKEEVMYGFTTSVFGIFIAHLIYDHQDTRKASQREEAQIQEQALRKEIQKTIELCDLFKRSNEIVGERIEKLETRMVLTDDTMKQALSKEIVELNEESRQLCSQQRELSEHGPCSDYLGNENLDAFLGQCLKELNNCLGLAESLQQDEAELITRIDAQLSDRKSIRQLSSKSIFATSSEKSTFNSTQENPGFSTLNK